MKLLNLFYDFFKSKKNVVESTCGRQLKDVKRGDIILIEWDRILNGIGSVTCLNNDPITKKILLRAVWSPQMTIELFILNYNSKELRNFSLLNPILETKVIDDDITTLKEKLNQALANEEYEKANEIQLKINNITSKK